MGFLPYTLLEKIISKFMKKKPFTFGIKSHQPCPLFRVFKFYWNTVRSNSRVCYFSLCLLVVCATRGAPMHTNANDLALPEQGWVGLQADDMFAQLHQCTQAAMHSPPLFQDICIHIDICRTISNIFVNHLSPCTYNVHSKIFIYMMWILWRLEMIFNNEV